MPYEDSDSDEPGLVRKPSKDSSGKPLVGGSVNVNAASYADLIAAGFTPQEAESVQNYRMKTGGFHRLEDLEFAGVAPGRVQELAPGLSLTGGEGD